MTKDLAKSITFRRSFFYKIFISFLAVVVVLIILMATIFSGSYISSTKELIKDFNKQLLAQSNYSVSYIDGLAKELSNKLAVNNHVVAFLNMKQWDNYTTSLTDKFLLDTIRPLDYVNSIYLYNGSHDVVYSTTRGEQLSLGEMQDKAMTEMLMDTEFLKEHKGKSITYNTVSKSLPPNVCSYITPDFAADGTLKHALIININISALTDTIRAINSPTEKTKATFFVLDNSGQILGDASDFYRLAEDVSEDIIHTLTQEKSQSLSFTMTINDEKYEIIQNYLKHDDWRLIGLYPHSITFYEMQKTVLVSIMIALIFLAVTTLVVLRISRNISKPVMEITQTIEGNFSDLLTSDTVPEDELDFLRHSIHQMKRQYAEHVDYRSQTDGTVKMNFLGDLLSRNIIYSSENLQERLENAELGYLLDGENSMGLIELDDYLTLSSSLEVEEISALRFGIANLTTEMVGSQFAAVDVLVHSSHRFVILVDLETSTEEMPQKVFENLLKDVQSSIQQHLRISVSVACSSPFHGVEQLATTYENLVDLMHQKLKYGMGCFLTPLIFEEEEFEDFIIPEQKQTALLHYIQTEDLSAAQESFLLLAEDMEVYSSEEIESYYFLLSYKIYETVLGKNPENTSAFVNFFQEFQVSLRSCEVLQQIYQLFEKLIAFAVHTISRTNVISSGSDDVIKRTLEIIHANYLDSNLCLTYIAQEIDLSANYLGRTFKKEQNITIAQYIMRLRMNKAAELLTEPELTIKEISAMVGIDSTNYFYTCFRRQFGKTPGDYRNQVLTEESM